MGLNRQRRRYLERQEAARQAGRKVEPITPDPLRFWTRARIIFAITASVATILSALYAFWPSMDVIAQPWETSTDPANARFQFKNIGRVTIRDVQFDCLINSATSRNLNTSLNSSFAPITGLKSQVIGDLDPDRYVSRDCFGGARVATGGHPSNIKVTASFVWPILNRRAEISRYFVSETDGRRVWMTPEAEPKP
jgi:hypothetical protein